MRRLIPLLALCACSRDLTLPPAQSGALRGRVTKDGTPVSGAEVRLDNRATHAISRADGAFSFKPVSSGTHALAVRFDSDSDGLAELTASRSDLLLEGGDDLDVGDIELRPTGAASGVIRGRGAPLLDALVFVPGTGRFTFSDASGSYVLIGLPAGTTTIAASGPGLVPQRRAVDIPSGDVTRGVDFDLADATGATPTGSFTATVRFTDDPLAKATATALAYSGVTLAAAADTTQGDFHLGPLMPGVFSLRVDATAHRTMVLPLQPIGLEDVDLGELWLEPGAPLPSGPETMLPMPDAGLMLPTSAVRGLLASGGDGRITLSWEPPTAGAQAYRVYRGTDPIAPLAALDGGLTAEKFFVDTKVTNYTRYYYRVTSLLSGVESPLDEAQQVAAFPGPGTVLTGGSGSMTLTPAGNPYVVTGGDLLVLAGQTLTLAPGTFLQMDPGLRVVVDGTLIARGTQAQPIYFTSRLPQPWSGIIFQNSSADAVLDGGAWVSGSVLEHAVVEKSNDTGVTIVGASPALIRCEIRNNFVDGGSTVPALGGGIYISAGSAPHILSSSIHHNRAGNLEVSMPSTQLGGGVYSAGDPVLIDNDISFNELMASQNANSSNHGAGVYLASGQATLAGNRFSANDVPNGFGMFSTNTRLSARGVAIALADGAHLVVGNLVEDHGLSRVDRVDFRGAVWAGTGVHVIVHNRIERNSLSGDMIFGAALAIDTASVRASLNTFEGNSLGGNGPKDGTALYTGDTISDLRFNNFAGNTPLGFEVYNGGVVTLDLSGSWFQDVTLPDGGLAPLSARVFRPAQADLSNLSPARLSIAGPKPCANDAACGPLGGAQRCLHFQCIPECLMTPCTVLQKCNPISGACE